MRRAVVMRKGIDSVSPRVGPVVLGKTLFKNGRRIFGIRYNCPPIEQQGKNTVWENAVALENESAPAERSRVVRSYGIPPREI